MDKIPGQGEAHDRRSFQQMVALHGAPAYALRAQRTQAAHDALLGACRKRREALLTMVRTRLALLHALAGGWEALRPLLAGKEHLDALRRLHAELAPTLRVKVEPTTSARALRRALAELVESMQRFNRRWEDYLKGVDLGPVNAQREGYNKYYVLEKECVLRSARLARQGFSPLPPLTLADLAEQLPQLSLPVTAR